MYKYCIIYLGDTMNNVIINNIIKDINNLPSNNIEFMKMNLQIKKGGYGEKDYLIGKSVPNLRKIAKKYYKEVDLNIINYFITNKIHEYRFLALLLILYKYPKIDDKIFNFYLHNIKYINNWDLVDLSAPKIIGKYIYENYNNKEILSFLNNLYNSENKWQRRIAIVSNLTLIKNNKYNLSLRFLKRTINDNFILNNKALGWMLREISKKDQELIIKFLSNNKVRKIDKSVK